MQKWSTAVAPWTLSCFYMSSWGRKSSQYITVFYKQLMLPYQYYYYELLKWLCRTTKLFCYNFYFVYFVYTVENCRKKRVPVLRKLMIWSSFKLSQAEKENLNDTEKLINSVIPELKLTIKFTFGFRETGKSGVSVGRFLVFYLLNSL